ncbi:MAG: LysR family transcriptional regulator [Chthoniobacteraceae bacterium]|nr:LysR family transcriptional regulator [Chthoniobacteraceae bacterium]
MNIHHLELFYYVAKHGGIASAVRNIPYGIQQPAISGQMAKLEESLGVKLFNRRPFALSAAGEELFRYVEPFFADMDTVAKKIRGAANPQLRIAAPTMVLHDYVPELLHRLRAKFPAFRLNIHEATQPEAEGLLQAQEIDLAVTSIEKKTRPGLHSQPLLELPLVLLVPKKHPLTDAKELWRRDKIEEPLITFPPTEPVFMQFQRGLKDLGVEWFSGIEVNSISLIECYVANGFGIGLTAAIPGMRSHPQVRRVPLAGFPPVTMGVVWAGKLSPISQQFLTEVQALAKALDCP